jgi:lipoprotein-releasing system permease protein
VSAPRDDAPSGEAGRGRSALRFDALPPVPEGPTWPTAWWLALRHLRSGGGERFLGLVSAICVLAVVVGVATLDTVLAVMTGFEDEMRDKILGSNAHIVVMQYGGGMDVDDAKLADIEGVDGVEAAAPFTYAEVMIRSKLGATGAVMKGIDPARTAEVTQARDQLRLGIDGELSTPEARSALFAAMAGTFTPRGAEGEALPGVLIGDEMAANLQVLPGDTVQVIDPIGKGGGILGIPTPTFKSFRVAGTFHSGMFEYDGKWMYVAIPEAQGLLKMNGAVTGVEVRVSDIDDVERISREIEGALHYPHYARHWRNLNQALFEALALERVVTSLILGMVMVVAGLLIVTNLYTLVLTRRREIAILKAMGASSAMVGRVFILVGSVIGAIGTALGSALGLGLCFFLDAYEYPLETDVYYLSSLPVVFRPLDFVAVAIAAFLICYLSTLYPARRAARVDPVDGLRVE